MNGISDLDQDDQDCLIFEISDDELERTATGLGDQLASFSVVWCCGTELICNPPG
jgi:hypothetical protein